MACSDEILIDQVRQRRLADAEDLTRLLERQDSRASASVTSSLGRRRRHRRPDLLPADQKNVKKIIVNVKGGDDVDVTMVKDLIATVAREKAAIGLFVTLTTPKETMHKEVAAAGLHPSGFVANAVPAPTLAVRSGARNMTPSS